MKYALYHYKTQRFLIGFYDDVDSAKARADSIDSSGVWSSVSKFGSVFRARDVWVRVVVPYGLVTRTEEGFVIEAVDWPGDTISGGSDTR